MLALLAALVIRGDQSQDALAAVNALSTALSNGDAAAAMAPFDKSFAQYDTLAAYLGNLAASYLITNEADIVDENDEADKTTFVFDWTLTLRNESTEQAFQRHGKVNVTVAKRGGVWKIIAFSPVSLFSPQM